MGNPSKLIEQLQKFPEAIVAGEVPRRNIEKVRNVRISMGYAFTVEAIKKKSVVAAGICSWLMNIVAFYDLATPVRPEGHKKVAAGEDTCSKAGITRAQRIAKDIQENMITKAGMQELKSLKAPPHDVKVVVSCLCIMRPLGTEDLDADWAGAKAMLSDPSCLTALLNFKVENLQEEQMTRVRELMSKERRAFEPNSIMKVSKAASGLVRWILSVVKRYEEARES